MEIQYWNKEIETADRATIEALQLEKLKDIADCAMRSPFYQRRLSRINIHSGDDIKSL
ncbi:MAG: phenylacetate--CoA ligase, partial [Candidatus Brocadiia bacterium]